MIKKLLKEITGHGATKMAIIIRTDLKIGRGKIASQTVHAAVTLYQSSIENSNPHLKTWLRCGQPKIVLKVDSDCESFLKDTHSLALRNNLNSCIVRDAGQTQIDAGSLTAVGIGPNKTEEVDKIIGGLKLL